LRRSYLLPLILCVVIVAGLAYMYSDPGMSSRYSQALRDAQLSPDSKELVTAAIAIAIAGYLGWFFLIRKR
jgi:hypothetical protein